MNYHYFMHLTNQGYWKDIMYFWYKLTDCSKLINKCSLTREKTDLDTLCVIFQARQDHLQLECLQNTR